MYHSTCKWKQQEQNFSTEFRSRHPNIHGFVWVSLASTDWFPLPAATVLLCYNRTRYNGTLRRLCGIIIIVSGRGMSLVGRQATFRNHVDFLANCDEIYFAVRHHEKDRETTVQVIICGIFWILYIGLFNWYFGPAHNITLESQKKRPSAISIIETEWSTYMSPKQGHCWFRQCLFACLMPSHSLNQYRIIVKWAIWNPFQWKNLAATKFIEEGDLKCRRLIVGHFVSALMFQRAWNIWFGMPYTVINLSNALAVPLLVQICCSIFIFHLR